ncbi:branched-chain amino acid transport system / permease component family protein [Bacillus cereus ATCC 4342]|uniref:ABC transporter permease n=1 Tax=Bacillus tropicus TaxID=2026188 RepID=UPI0005087836|nr:autoinducer 2 import system permease LsrD [Bacillus tropicus]AJH73709.1 branched-chain amino acid transport system / permease component family protein [Bacillus cereus ATCC 4342]KFM88042.1 branched-chain amino acid transport system / permease component family protein [Bacillus cereus ATCC 4342]MCU5000958.1 autoinducer 2 import system permease LsrD [Bacillus tropicus]MDR4453582.1 autoinducer 2 import system permease LsrD [Bacillus tropicus]MED3379624.1 autoinducer 2 import system permease Ls
MKYVYRWEGVLIVLLLIEFILFSLINSDFLNISNLLFSTNDFLFIAIAAIPMTFVIVTGGIDVSVGSIMGLTSILIGVLWMNGIPILFAVIIALIISCLAGAINGFIIKMTDVEPLVVTLGTMFLYGGIALVISGGAGASGYEGISGLPDTFVQLANGSFIGIPNLLWLLIVLTVLCTVLFHRTIYGRHVKLTGANENTAKYTGIKTKKVVIIAYILSGLGGGLGGAFLTAYFGSARADMGSETILPIITAVVLGGTLITGGKGSIIGTVLASIFIGLMQYGLQMTGLTNEQSNVVIGIILILSVIMRHFKLHQFLAEKRRNLHRGEMS